MSMLWILMRVELLKIRRSLVLLMMLACPLFVVLLNVGMSLKSGRHALDVADPWPAFWLINIALWGYFMLPLYIGLVTALINGNEHKNGSWRLMLTLPVGPRQLYLAKALLAWLFVCGANVVLWLYCVLAIAALALFGYPGAGMVDTHGTLALMKICFACLPVIVIQHYVSWRFANFIAPLALAVCATMGVLQIGSSQYWKFFPWSYALMASNGAMPARQEEALIVAAIAGVALLLGSSFVVGRREITA